MLLALKLHTLPLTNCMQVTSPTLLNTYTLLSFDLGLRSNPGHTSLATYWQKLVSKQRIFLKVPQGPCNQGSGQPHETRTLNTHSHHSAVVAQRTALSGPGRHTAFQLGNRISFIQRVRTGCLLYCYKHSLPCWSREKDENPVTWQQQLPPHLLLVLSDTLKPWPGSRQSVDTNTNEPPAKGD